MLKRLCFILFSLFSSIVYAQTDDNDDLFVDIKRRFGLNDYLGCIEACDKLLALLPGNGDAYYYKAYAKYLLGDVPGAEKDMELSKRNSDELKVDRSLKFWLSKKKKMDFLVKYFYKGEDVFPETNYRPKYARKDSLRGSLRPERTCFDVTFYDLHVKINPQKKFILGSTDITFKVVGQTSKIQIDLFERFKIESITWKGKTLAYQRQFDAVFVQFPKVLEVGKTESVSISYEGSPIAAPNPPWDGGFVWKKDEKGNYWCGVACEHLGASSWWPNKDHPADEPDSARMTFSVPNGYDLVSNGRFRGKKPDGKDYTQHTWFVANPINNYNITFYLGKFTHFSDTLRNSKGKYPLDYYVLTNHFDEAVTCFEQVKDVLSYYERAFGDYPFMNEKYSLVESPYEGMEHQTAIAYGNEFNKRDKDQAYLHKKWDYIIVHETAHEWWGNSVTASDMADIWLQEGFATYAELMFMENQYGYQTYLQELHRKEQGIYNVWPLVQNYGVNENSFASNDCYNKGAAILNNLRCCINNDSLFFRLIRDFAIKYKKQIVTTSDFVNRTNEYTGRNYGSFFKKYLYDNKLPVLKYTYTRKGKDILLKYWWSEVDADFEMPLCINTVSDNIKLEATTKPQEILLKNCSTVRFYTVWTDPEDAKPNSYTYYWTRCSENE
jgi:aminopeptidase N